MTDHEPHELADDGPDDAALLRDLATALTAMRGITEVVAERGKRSYTWRSIDADLLLAELSFDSDLQAAGSTRAGTEARRLEFTAALQSVELEVFDDRLVGQFLPGGPGTVTVERDAGDRLEATVSELGFFTVRPVPRGLVRFRCVTPHSGLVSDWVLL